MRYLILLILLSGCATNKMTEVVSDAYKVEGKVRITCKNDRIPVFHWMTDSVMEVSCDK